MPHAGQCYFFLDQGLAQARLLKLQHETEPAVVALHGVLRWQPSVASAPVSGASPDEQPSPTSPSLCAQVDVHWHTLCV